MMERNEDSSTLAETFARFDELTEMLQGMSLYSAESETKVEQEEEA